MNDTLGWLVTLGLLIALGFIARAPYVWQDKLLENRKSKNSSQLQRESFFKQLGGQGQKDVFDRWTRRITYMEKVNDEAGAMELMDLIHQTVVYGSDRTVNALASMMQYVYTHPYEDDDDGVEIGYTKDDSQMIPMYTAFIISCLKDDFAGYSVDPLTIIQLKISDYDDLRGSYQRCLKRITSDVDERTVKK